MLIRLHDDLSPGLHRNLRCVPNISRAKVDLPGRFLAFFGRNDAGHLATVDEQRAVAAAVVLRIFGDLVPEQVLEEADGGLRLGRGQFRPDQRTWLVERLPGPVSSR